ncbi:TIGR02270 family protein [uncultured Lamprocystis sp.]|jgi:uncharacterized protein (TIGR02270 family)|uniref:TIGR02270 family protein n=1 Tax=uncultured Lamprocystis sp. TaxID=543132 RepID=UPI0025F84902|nr:TIGR02270 family protein [uncultured Lamprocystis sp.]
MLATSHQPVLEVIQQHAEESAILRHTRSVLVRAPHVKLHHLARIDERIAAHLDGLTVAGEFGAGLCQAALETPGTGEVFAAAVGAIASNDRRRLDRLFALTEALPEAYHGLISAFGWVSAHDLQGLVVELLAATEPVRQEVGIASCIMHRVDPGSILTAAIDDPDPRLRACALRAAGEAGRRDLIDDCLRHLQDDDPSARFRAAMSSLLLGNRDLALSALGELSSTPGPLRAQALGLWLKAVDLPSGHHVLQSIAKDAASRRLLIQATGVTGQVHYIPWLIGLMADDQTARLAGESFSFVTGLDLAWLDLERRPPEGFEPGPSDDPADESVDMDPDDSLPWPDQAKIQAWWEVSGQRLQSGGRYFMGEPVTVEHCQRVLREGYQRQRRAAAEYLCLLTPGTPLFPIAAPAWRQARWLAADQPAI